jgi:ribosomal protein S18 acetylase RimI-like enzyme
MKGVDARVDAMEIRPALPTDAQNLAALAIQVWLHTYATQGLRDALSAYVLEAFTPGTFRTRMEDPRHLLLVVEHDRHLVAYAELDFEAPREDVLGVSTELATLYVQEHFAGQGLGKRLLEACAEATRRRTGSASYWLSVYHGNANAIGFYRKQGFTERGAFDFEFGGEKHRNLVMARN